MHTLFAHLKLLAMDTTATVLFVQGVLVLLVEGIKCRFRNIFCVAQVSPTEA